MRHGGAKETPMNHRKLTQPLSNLREPAPASAPPLLYSILEASHLLGVSRTTLFSLLKAGTVRSVRLGKRRLIPASALEELVARLGGGR